MRYSPADFKYSTEYGKHISCLSYELKTKYIDGKSKQPRHHIHKGWYVLIWGKKKQQQTKHSDLEL